MSKENMSNGQDNNRNNDSKSDLRRALEDLKKVKDRIGDDIERLKTDKTALLNQINLYNIYIKEARDGSNERTAQKWQKQLANAESLLKKIDGVIEVSDATEDHDLLIEVQKKLTQLKKVRETQKRKEDHFHENPEDKRAEGDINRARTEAYALEQEIESLINQGKESIEQKIPNLARDEGIHYTNEQAQSDREEWEKKHNQKPPEEFTGEAGGGRTIEEEYITQEQPKIHDEPVRELRDESSYREDNLNAEKINDNEQSFEFPQVNHEEKDNKDGQAEARRAVEHITSGMPYIRGEKDSEQVIEAFLKKQKENITSELLLPPREELLEIEAPYRDTTKEELEGEDISSFSAELSSASKETRDRLLKNLENKENAVFERAQKIGANTLEFIRKRGEEYKALPLKTKLAITAGLIVTASASAVIGGATGTAIATAAATGSLGQRILGGMATFVGLEGLLKSRAQKKAEKTGTEYTKIKQLRDTTLAVVAGYIVGSGTLAEVLQKISLASAEIMQKIPFETIKKLPGIALEDWSYGIIKAEHPISQTVPNEIRPEVLPTETTTPPEKIVPTETTTALIKVEEAVPPVETTSYLETAKQGDSRWTLSERQLEKNYGEKFTNLPLAQKTYLIDAVKDKISAGMSESATNKLSIGETVDFGTVFSDKQFFDEQFEKAMHLTATPENIESRIMHDANISETTPTENNVSQDIHTESYNTPSIPQEIIPNDPQVLVYANRTINEHLDELFGKKGFLGFGGKAGSVSVHWSDPNIGFANKNVDEILNTNTETMGSKNASFGIKDAKATSKMQAYLEKAMDETKIKPNPGEKTDDYLHRAVAINIGKFINSKTA